MNVVGSEVLMTDQDLNDLKNEKNLCKQHIVPLRKKLEQLNKERKETLDELLLWKKRFEAADLELAEATKLTKGNGRKKSTIDAFMQDKEKVNKLIKLLEENKK